MKKVFDFIKFGNVSVILLVSSFLFSSCFHTGLGEEIDLEAPVLNVKNMVAGGVSVSNFEGGVYCGKSIVFNGSASDNNRIERVYAQVKWSDEEEYSATTLATLSGNDWSLSLSLEKEESCMVRIVAEDPAKNISPKSTKTITLFVDESAPVANGWYIDRQTNGITYNLSTKEKLEELDLDLPENKDAPQNVSFLICATATDLYGVSDIVLHVKDEEGKEVASVQRLESSTEYGPKFEITHELLVAGDSSLASGKHYLQISYDSEDITEYPESNKSENVEVELGWFIWWPESDLPKIVNSEIVSESSADGQEELSLNVYVKDVINLSVFDDDVLDCAYLALLSESEAAAFGTVDWNKIKENPSLIIDAVSSSADADGRSCVFTASGERDSVLSLTAPATPQTMTLLAVAWDKTSARKCCTKSISVRVTDESSPILLISSPKNNSIPQVSEQGKISIEGQTLDSAGCTYLEFVWVPSSYDDKKSVAKAWLDEVTSSENHMALASSQNRVSEKNGLKLWSVPLSEAGMAGSFYKLIFAFDLNLFSDFISKGVNEQASDKYFLIKLTRKDGNSIYQEYTLAADTLLPEITAIMPSVNMQIIQDTEDITLKFSAKKSTGIPIDTSSYKIERVDVGQSLLVTNSTDGFSNVGYNTESLCYEATLLKSKIQELSKAGTMPKFRFTAKDVFGNENSAQYTLVISELPLLKSISTSSSAMCKAGDTIDIVASFSKTVAILGNPRVKLKGISNALKSIGVNDAIYAYYSGGNGSTNIHFTYTVAEGDISSSLCLYDSKPLDDNGSSSFTEDKVSINELSDSDGATAVNLFDSKHIQLDGVMPKVTSLSFDGNGNTVNGLTYIKESSTLSAVLNVSEYVIVQGDAYFSFYVNGSKSEKLVLPFAGLSGSGSQTKITFSKTISQDEKNGLLSYSAPECLAEIENICDSFGNPLLFAESLSNGEPKICVDTFAPATPVCKGVNATLANNAKYKDSLSFTLTKASDDDSIRWLQYSTDGGSYWLDYTEKVTLLESASFTYRAVDYAGNVSEIPEPIYLDIESSFPAFSLECENSDGNYKAGKTITLRLSFVRPVNVPASSSAYITVSGQNSEDRGGGKAFLSSSEAQSNVSNVDFTYTVTSADDFTLKVAKDAIKLTGFTDEYGIGQGGKTLSADYTRNIRCDGIAPSVSAFSDGAGTSGSSGAVFSQGNKIVLTFSEPVIKSSGNIKIRRAGTWALPPVLSVSDFNKICNKVSDKNILSLQENGSDMEDSEWVNGSNADYKNQYYHGSGQFVGPYKKSTQGILDSGEPDVTAKYVLDFDMGIWETNESHYYGKTFTFSTQTAPSQPSQSRTASQIRASLEEAGYHQRVLDVTSSNVEVSGSTVTITFKKENGLCDTSDDLPAGIEWEVLVDAGAFMDECGNDMSEYKSSAFLSSGVSTPVIRLDRYSYGLGIKQADSSGGTAVISGDSIKPSGYVRVRIDCQTPGASISYGVDKSSSLGIESTSPTVNDAYSKYKASSAVTKSSLSTQTLGSSYTKDLIFAAGNGNYKTACRQYVVAQASHSTLGTSEKAYEGVFQTVVRIVEPKQGNNTYSVWQMSDEFDDFSIRGTTGWSGEPYISPFPLRDAQIGSPYLRLCFKGKEDSSNSDAEKKDYYWLSYEILVDSSYSGHVRNNTDKWEYIRGWGWVTPGGYSEAYNMYAW